MCLSTRGLWPPLSVVAACIFRLKPSWDCPRRARRTQQIRASAVFLSTTERGQMKSPGAIKYFPHTRTNLPHAKSLCNMFANIVSPDSARMIASSIATTPIRNPVALQLIRDIMTEDGVRPNTFKGSRVPDTASSLDTIKSTPS